jgi:hypothetical protein
MLFLIGTIVVYIFTAIYYIFSGMASRDSYSERTGENMQSYFECTNADVHDYTANINESGIQDTVRKEPFTLRSALNKKRYQPTERHGITFGGRSRHISNGISVGTNGTRGGYFGGRGYTGRGYTGRGSYDDTVDDFPYWNLSLPDRFEMFNRIKYDNPLDYDVFTADDGTKVLRRKYPSDYRVADGISNHYTEYERVKCSILKLLSPKAVWERNLRTHPESLSLKGDPEALREFVYSKTKECNIFNPVYVKFMISQLFPDGGSISMIDPSSGWGDRMIGALAFGVTKYLGFDPNAHLIPGYTKIIEELCPLSECKDSEVLCQEFEKANVGDIEGLYDIALTSPPYYTLELYGRNEIVMSYADWKRIMYIPYLENMSRALKPGGYLVIYIENWGQYPMQSDTHEILINQCGVEYDRKIGILVVADGSTKEGKIRYAWVYKKQ